MINKACVNCKKPMNGGVYRKPNQCPHCLGLQDKTRSADNKRKVTLEQALKARASARSRPVPKPQPQAPKHATPRTTAASAAARELA